MPRSLSDGPSSSAVAVLALLAANLVPLIGVLFFGWSLFGVLLIYWVESGIIGLFNIPRILLAQGNPSSFGWHSTTTGTPSENTLRQRIGTVLFFLVHYGGFWIGHLLLLSLFLGEGLTEGTPTVPSEQAALGFMLTIATLFVSHGVSFGLNYLGRGEYRTALPIGQMWAPYGRVIAFQIAALGGGALAGKLGSPIWALVLLVVLKTAVDAGTHVVSHTLAVQRG